MYCMLEMYCTEADSHLVMIQLDDDYSAVCDAAQDCFLVQLYPLVSSVLGLVIKNILLNFLFFIA